MSFSTQKIKNKIHLIFAIIANVYNRFPGKSITVIGVTGTDGKTTTSNLIYHILKESGRKVAVVSTIGAIIDGKNYETGFHVTTPSPFAIQKYLRLAKEKGCTHVVLEVTSHALDQERVWGIPFRIGVLTNITHEHLDYHKSYEAYVSAKLRLLKIADIAIVNSNGEWFERVKSTIPKDKLIPYSLHGERNGSLSLLTMPFTIKTSLIGDFNLENIIAATASAMALGVDTTDIESAVESFKAPSGRQEQVSKNVIVDFAHTANSFESILSLVRKRTTGRLIHVFGCAGQRDREKRPEMGKAASFYDDIIILTSEDPRTEDVERINQEIKKGIADDFEMGGDNIIKKGKAVYEIKDRRKAIEFALALSSKNDTVIITGKGHEKSMNYGHGEQKWSDQAVVKDYFKQKNEI
jgi:UDP-N-acetylmuramoyl-L-alanyl-D-glutamate--2,6-diaminopimelate ligase